MITGDVEVREFEAFAQEAIAKLDSDDEKRKVIRALALEFIGRVVPETPVDTGRARGGWTAMPGSATAAGVRGAAAAEGRKLSDYTEQIGPGSAFGQITNGLPYIVYLELGSSMQAPSGFVRRVLREMLTKAGREVAGRTDAALRLANIKARALGDVRQGIGRRPGSGRINISRR